MAVGEFAGEFAEGSLLGGALGLQSSSVRNG